MSKKKNKDKIPLVLFSGGMDSTYMLHQLLKEGDVDTLYIKAGQAPDKVAKELIARKKIIWLLEKITGNRVRRDLETEMGQLFCGMPDHSWSQPAMWMTGALHHIDGNKHSQLAIGYVSDDGIVSRLHNLQRAWHHLQKFSKHSKPAPVKFPQHTTTKQTIMKMIDERLWEHIWVCELPHDVNGVTVACGCCVPCLTQHGQLAIYKQSTGQDYHDHIADGVETWKRRDEKEKVDNLCGPTIPSVDEDTSSEPSVDNGPLTEVKEPHLRLEKSA